MGFPTLNLDSIDDDASVVYCDPFGAVLFCFWLEENMEIDCGFGICGGREAEVVTFAHLIPEISA